MSQTTTSAPSSELDDLETAIAKRLRTTRNDAVGHLTKIRQIDEKVRAVRAEATSKAGEQAKRSKDRVVCPTCRNDDERQFANFEREGSVVCQRCGTVVMEGQVHDGEWVRQYEGDEDPSFHGPPPDLRFSSEHNLRTGFAQPDKPQSGATGMSSATRELSLLQTKVEMDLSNMGGANEKRTRQGYKDEMKRKFFELMDDAGNALQIIDGVVERGKTLFAQVRDEIEQLHDAEGVAAGCFIQALREGIQYERKGVKRRVASDTELNPFRCRYCGVGFGEKKSLRWHIKDECEKKPAAGAKREGASS